MIYQILTEENCYTTKKYVADWAPQMAGQFHLIPIEKLHEAERLPVGTFLFSDLEKLTPERRRILGRVYELLERHGAPMRLINHPLRSKGRYDLLSCLHEHGVNRFRGFRANEIPRDLRFPVFLRVERDHKGALTPLIETCDELERSLARCVLEGNALDDMLAIEYCDTRDHEGVYRKYNAYRVGNRIIPRGVTFATEWQVKGRDDSAVWRAEEKREYVFGNPHRERLMEIFELAGIEYGRADYGIADGQIQVWEINTCPLFSIGVPHWYFEERRALHQHVADRLAEALMELGQPVSNERVPIQLSWPIGS